MLQCQGQTTESRITGRQRRGWRENLHGDRPSEGSSHQWTAALTVDRPPLSCPERPGLRSPGHGLGGVSARPHGFPAGVWVACLCGHRPSPVTQATRQPRSAPSPAGSSICNSATTPLAGPRAVFFPLSRNRNRGRALSSFSSTCFHDSGPPLSTAPRTPAEGVRLTSPPSH